jgi:hypothetical protein
LRERLAAFRKPTVPKLSDIVAAASQGTEERISLEVLAERLSARGLAPIVLVVGILNMFAVIPGTSTILGLPLLFLGLGLMAGARKLWLPASLRHRSIDRAALDAAIARAIPYLKRVERLARPRYWPGGEWILYRVFGAVVFVAAVVIVLPIPFGNLLPAITVALIAIGFIERDGLWVLGGITVAVIEVFVITVLAEVATNAVRGMFG